MRKKLSLRSETVRLLQGDNLRNIRGGVFTDGDSDMCPTFLCAPTGYNTYCCHTDAATCGGQPRSEVCSQVFTCVNTCTG